MRQPEEIKMGLECCGIEYRCPTDCRDCPYVDIKPLCIGQIFREALTYIRQLEAQAPRWISVEERLPEEGGKYIVCTVKGRVYCTHFRLLGSSGVFQTDINTHIAYWMPLPEGLKEGE